jgi:cytochrome P450
VPLPGGRSFFRSIAAIDQAMLALVAARRAQPVERGDMLSLLLEARDPDTGGALSDREIRDQLVTLFVAGLDTTAVALTWLLHLHSQHPAVEARLRAELAAVLGGRLPTAADLPKLSYTRAVLQETMRLYPPAWIIPRYTATGAEVGGRWIAPGSSLLVSPFLAHRNPLQWERPDSFEPERFAEGATKNQHRLAYIPFGAGGRMCIGNHFAMMEGVLATAMILQRFRPTPSSDRPVLATAASTLKPKGGLQMRMAAV